MELSESRRGKSAGQICCFYPCSNTTYSEPKVSLHQFPDPEKDPDRFQKWVAVVSKHRDNWSPPQKQGPSNYRFRNTKVCSDHFEKECFIESGVRRRLKPGAVPTIYWTSHPSNKPTKRKSAVSRRSALPQVSFMYDVLNFEYTQF